MVGGADAINRNYRNQRGCARFWGRRPLRSHHGDHTKVRRHHGLELHGPASVHRCKSSHHGADIGFASFMDGPCSLYTETSWEVLWRTSVPLRSWTV